MNDETLLVIFILGGIAVMIVGLVAFMRRQEARLAAQDRIEIPIHSTGRTLIVVFPALVVVPVIASVTGAVTDPWLRGHALAAVIGTMLAGGASLLAALALTRKFRATGALVLSANLLELVDRGRRQTMDPKRPFALFEARSLGEESMPLQLVLVTQDGRSWGFAYGLALGKKAYGDAAVGAPPPPGPLLGGAARVVHDRLRAEPAMSPDRGTGPWRTDDGVLECRDGRWFLTR